MNARINLVDDRHFDELFARRVELFTTPAPAGQPATEGRVVFHTVWLHYRDGAVFAESDGPRITHTFDSIIGRTWDVPDGEGGTIPLPTLLMMGGLKVAFDTIYNEMFPAEPGEDPEPADPEPVEGE